MRKSPQICQTPGAYVLIFSKCKNVIVVVSSSAGRHNRLSAAVVSVIQCSKSCTATFSWIWRYTLGRPENNAILTATGNAR